MTRYKIIVEYDGTPFQGWQQQSGFVTVQERLEQAILPLSKVHTRIHGAGRTDAGVHALGQAAHFDLNKEIDPFVVQQCMNHYLNDVPVSILSAEIVSDDFHARFKAIEREYIYRILNRRAKPAVDANKAWWVVRELNADLMHDTAQCLLGTHDFSAFRAQGCQSKSPIKTVSKVSVTRNGACIEFLIRANAFLYHQVRNIVGSLYNVGCGKWTCNTFIDVMEAKNRAQSGMTTPACGLYLNKVYY